MTTTNKKKVEIIKAANRIFQTKGFHESKIEEIAKEARVGKGTVYEYFSSKKEVFEEACLVGMDELYNALENIKNSNKTFKEKIIEIFKYKYRNINIKRGLAESFYASGDLISENIKNAFISFMLKNYTLIMEIVKEGIKEGVIAKDSDTELIACYIMGISNQYLGLKLFYYNLSEEEIDFEKIFNSFINGFKP